MKKLMPMRLFQDGACFILLAGLLLPVPTRAQFYYPNPITPVTIVSPANHSVFYAPVDIPIYAYARDNLRLTYSGPPVRFYAGSTYLGLGQWLGITNLPPRYPPIYPAYQYGRDQCLLVWSNPPVGTYALTAVVSNYNPLVYRPTMYTSAPVYISVQASAPPASNATDVVSIIATDPLAIEGTNCWRWRGITNATPTWTNWPTPIWGWFTNCGPKDATFAVRRYGDCNQALTVAYTTSGTATNGTQYVSLPGFVTIPAGQAYALISLVPLDDGAPDVTRTAILTLSSSTAQPSAYQLGFPRSAAALILDSNGLCPVTGMLPGKSFYVNATGPDGAWFHVEYSTDLQIWTALCTNQVVNGGIDFVDSNAAADSGRYYRAVPELNPPGE
jgi:hypothetical protein